MCCSSPRICAYARDRARTMSRYPKGRSPELVEGSKGSRHRRRTTSAPCTVFGGAARGFGTARSCIHRGRARIVPSARCPSSAKPAAMTRSAILRPLGTTITMLPNSFAPGFTSPLRITINVSSRMLPVKPNRYSCGSPCAGTFAPTLRPSTSV